MCGMWYLDTFGHVESGVVYLCMSFVVYVLVERDVRMWYLDDLSHGVA